MKARLSSSLLGITTLATVLVAALYWGRSQASPSFQRPAPTDLDGRQIVSNCRKTLENSQGFVVELTQEIDLFGQRVIGEGKYLQRGAFGLQTRIDMVYSSRGSKVADLQQIDNGRFVLTRYQTPAHPPQLKRIDLDRVRSELDWANVALPHSGMSTASGLLGLARSFERDFDFGPPQVQDWDGQEVWVVVGRWKARELKRRFGIDATAPDIETQLARIPDPFPTHVELVVGTNSQLPFFPYRIDFLRRKPGNQGIEEHRIGRIDMQRIDFRTIPDEVEFQLAPGDDIVTDETAEFIAHQRQQELNLR